MKDQKLMTIFEGPYFPNQIPLTKNYLSNENNGSYKNQTRPFKVVTFKMLEYLS